MSNFNMSDAQFVEIFKAFAGFMELHNQTKLADTKPVSPYPTLPDPWEPTEPVVEPVVEPVQSETLSLTVTTALTLPLEGVKALDNFRSVSMTADEVDNIQAVDDFIDGVMQDAFLARKSWLRNVTSGDCISASRRVRNMLSKAHPDTVNAMIEAYEVDTSDQVYIGKRSGRNCYANDPLVGHAINIAIRSRLEETRKDKFNRGDWVVISDAASVERFIKRIHDTANVFESSAQRNSAKRLFMTLLRGETSHANACAKFYDVELGIIFRPVKFIKWLAASV
jgi:hypothetical protein